MSSKTMSLSCVSEIGRELAINLDSIYKFYHNPKRLKKEVNRLKTFENWPVEFIDPKKLAKDGFFYTKTADVCRCAFCFIDIGFWTPGDDVRENHRAASPACPMVKGVICSNVPISEAATESDPDPQSESDSESDSESELELEYGPQPRTEVEGYDVCGPYGMEIRPFSGPEKPGKNSLLSTTNHLCKYFEQLGVSKVSGPVSPQFATYEVRLETYRTWKYHEIQRPEKLAQAGFYHISRGDQVLCFYCGAGLHKWKPEDDPWMEHARHSFKCGFIILHKGTKFIQDALERRKVILTSSEIKNILNNSDHLPGGEVEKSLLVHQTARLPQTPPPIDPPVVSEERLKELSDFKLCRICYVRERKIVFLPCGHFISCNVCASSLNSCALCRTRFEAVVRTSLSSGETDSETCMVCKSAQKEVVFLPCSHFISCSDCSVPTSTCALCQKRFKLVVRVYLS